MKKCFSISLFVTSVIIIQIKTAPIPITVSSINENPLPSSPPNLKPYQNPKFNQLYKPPYPGHIHYPQYPRPILYQRLSPPVYIGTYPVNAQPIGIQYLDNDTLSGLGEIDETNICEVKGKFNQLCLLKGSMDDDEETQYRSSYKCLKQAKCSFSEGKCQWLQTTKYKYCSIFFKRINEQSDN